MRYAVHWGLDHATRIASSADLDRLLVFLTTARGHEGAPYAIDLVPAGDGDGGLQIGVGHPERAFVLCLRGGGYGIQPELDPWPEPIAFDCGHDVYDFKPAWTRVRPATAVRAAHEYIRTGALPDFLLFDPNA